MVDQSFGFQKIWSVSKDLVGFKGFYRTFLVFLSLVLSLALGLLLLDNAKMQTLSHLP